jgi:lysozyme
VFQAVTPVTAARWRGVRLRLLALIPLLLVGAVLVPTAGAAATTPQGVDTSKYQHDDGGALNWGAVRRSGRSFAFLKATGTKGVDPWFARDWAAAGRAGIVRGAYHYADPSQPADAQAAFAVQTVGSTREAGNLGIALDLESTGGLGPEALAAWAHTFLDGVERRTGRVPILYTYVSFWHNAMADNRSFGAYPLWLARYGPRPEPLAGWSQWTFWQHSSSAHVPGIAGFTDVNTMCCSSGTLNALADGRTTAITALWRRLGAASGTLGLPLGQEVKVPGGWAQSFQRGYVVSTKDHGTFPVLGSILARYRATGGTTGVLGVPTEAAQDLGLGATRQIFVGGLIVDSPATGAHSLRGDVALRWRRDGGLRSQEGLPVAEPVVVGQQFRGGGLYRTRSGVHLVPGAINDRYLELGGPTSILGLPAREAQLLLGSRLVQFDAGTLAEITAAGQTVVV